MQHLFIYLVLATYQAFHIHAQPAFNEIFTTFNRPLKKGGQCSQSQNRRLNKQFPDMQSSAETGKQQLPYVGGLPDQAISPLLETFFDAAPPPPDAPSDGTQTMRSQMREVVSGDVEVVQSLFTTTKPSEPEQFDGRSLIFCGSTPVKLMLSTDPVPWQDPATTLLRRKIGQLWDNSEDDNFWYLYIDEIQALGRVRKEALPPNPQDQDYGGEPFAEYPKGSPLQGSGPSFCAATGASAWSFTVDKFGDQAVQDHVGSRLIVILCEHYFEERSTYGRRRFLPDRLDGTAQREETPLDVMQPAWFAWYTAVAQAMRETRFPDSPPLVPKPAYLYAGPKAEPIQQRYFVKIKHRAATTSFTCYILAAWQRADHEQTGLDAKATPTIFNPASITWFVIGVRLQQLTGQSWNWGYAGPIPGGGGEGIDDGDGGDGGNYGDDEDGRYDADDGDDGDSGYDADVDC